MPRAPFVALVLALSACGYSKIRDPDAGTSADAGAPGGGGGGGVIPGGCFDNDDDGVPGTGDCASEPLVDCDDQDPTVSPSQAEVCDEKDNDCDGAADEDLPLLDHYADPDGDGYGAGASTRSCHDSVAGLVNKDGDCNEQDPLIHPNAPESCNQTDDDCDGQTDEDVQTQSFYTDADNDGFGAGAATVSCQPSLPGKVTVAGDCNDSNPAIKPTAAEVCNGADDNCDGQTDETFATKGNACQTGMPGVCAQGTRQCVSAQEQCVPVTPASAERCDGLDNDCNGQTDEAFPNLNTACTSGLGVCQASGAYVCSADQSATQCTAAAGSPNAAACDGQDNDCDGQVDEPELTTWWDSSGSDAVNATAMDVAPFFFTASGCNGGQSGTGTDAWGGYYAAYVVGGDLSVQRLWEDGDNRSTTLDISDYTSNQDVAAVQAGTGIAVVARYSTNFIDLYYVAPGPALRTIGGSKYANLLYLSSGSVSNVRAVRGYGGRFVVLWSETTTAGTKIRMARYHFTLASGSDYTLVTDTAPKDLVPATTGAFGAASALEEYGDTVGCPAPATLAHLGVAYVLYGSPRQVRFGTFTEDGTAYGTVGTVYSTTSTTIDLGEPDVAWAYASGDRWGVVHTYAASGAERVNFWQSAQAGASTAFGPDHTGNGVNSVTEPRIAARGTEFLISALVYGGASDPQVWAGKKAHGGATVRALSQLTWTSGCSLASCTTGSRRLPRAMSSNSGTYKTEGAVLFGTGTDVRAGDLGCN